MNKRSAIGAAIRAATVVLVLGCLPAQADALRLGVQAGLKQWNVDWDVRLIDQKGAMEPDTQASVGVLGQYIFEAPAEGERPFFVGFELGLAQEGVSHSETVDILEVPVDAQVDVTWSTDALWIVGYDFGRVSAFLAGGGSYIASELEVSGAGLTGADQNNHFGWKIAPGVEIALGESSSLLVRADYALYQAKKYTGSAPTLGDVNVDIDVTPRLFDVRVAWVYEFESMSLPRLFGR